MVPAVGKLIGMIANRMADYHAPTVVGVVTKQWRDKMKVELKPKDLQTKSTDSRGRFTLGSEYANKEVTVMVVESDDEDTDE